MDTYRGTKQHVIRMVIWSSIIIGLVALSGIIGTGVLRTAPAHAASPAMGSMADMDRSSLASMDRMMTAASKAAPLTMMLHKKVVHVTIDNYAFHPARLEVSRGTKIIWTNQDSDPHTVSSTKNIWSSEALDTDGTFARAFTKDGTFPYYCRIHPFMQASVIVKG